MQVIGAIPAPMTSGIMHLLLKLDAKMTEHSSVLSSLKRETSELRRCVGSLQSVASKIGDSPGVASAPISPSVEAASCSRPRQQSSAFQWICPVCTKNFCDRESFKGHIRGLTHHVRCVWSSTIPHHCDLVHKFPGDDFASKASACSSALYAEVCACTSSLDTESQSHVHICTWIDAAKSRDAHVAFPRYDTGNRRERKRRSRGADAGSSISSDAAHCNSSKSGSFGSESSGDSP
jgi:hypothetical protein